jgi:ribose transport system substrate-binding protein
VKTIACFAAASIIATWFAGSTGDIAIPATRLVRRSSTIRCCSAAVPSEVSGLVGLWSYNGPAILNAVREAGKIGKVKIVAFDEADETLAGISAGAIEATVVQQPYEFGYQAIQKMAQAARGDRSFIPASKQIIVPTLVVNRGNVEAFTKRINELRGRK